MNTDTGKAVWVSSHTELPQHSKLHGNFISLVSHEIKTPITSIKGYVQLLLMMLEEHKEIALPSEFRTSLTRIDKQVWQLTRLITEMVELSRIEAGKFEMYDEKFSINQLVGESVETICSTHPQHSIRVISDLDCEVQADQSRIQQVILNFLTNAIKYSGTAEEIVVHIHKNKDKVAVSVMDHGVGIEKKEQQKIFERYYHEQQPADQTYPGFGIGLYIAKSIIEKYHGTIGVQSEKGKGSVFTFCLPIVASKKIVNGKANEDIDS
jgi:signal transduction histidine kinase